MPPRLTDQRKEELERQTGKEEGAGDGQSEPPSPCITPAPALTSNSSETSRSEPPPRRESEQLPGDHVGLRMSQTHRGHAAEFSGGGTGQIRGKRAGRRASCLPWGCFRYRNQESGVGGVRGWLRRHPEGQAGKLVQFKEKTVSEVTGTPNSNSSLTIQSQKQTDPNRDPDPSGRGRARPAGHMAAHLFPQWCILYPERVRGL